MEWHMSKAAYLKMKRKSLSEFEFSPDSLTINGKSASCKSIHTRGKSSKLYWRKSYSVSLTDHFDFPVGEYKLPMKRFYLLSMSMDRNYLRNRLSFACLNKLDLFPLWYHYIELKINDQTEGLYLLVERPSDHLRRELDAKAILRRFSSNRISKDKYADGSSQLYQKRVIKTFKAITEACKKLKGEELFNTLDECLDMKAYFRWLAFNYLVRNGDYSDEVFYYDTPSPSQIRFGILPWDFDDIFSLSPHEGNEQRSRLWDQRLIFSREDPLDRTIATDPFLYQQYLHEVETFCKILSGEPIAEITNSILDELLPYYRDSTLIAQSDHDRVPAVKLLNLEDELARINDYLQSRLRMMKRLAVEFGQGQ